MKIDVEKCKDLDDLGNRVAGAILNIAKESVEQRGRFTIALSGGKTPVELYKKLAAVPILEEMPWKETHFFWGDERCVPPDSKDSNFRMAEETLFSKINMPEGNIHRILAEIKPPEKAAELYENDIRSFFGVGESAETPSFDLIVLGLGIDGHTASIFPGSDVIHENQRLIAVSQAPKGAVSKWRVTFTLPLINSARNIFFLAAGEEKGKIVREIVENSDRSQLVYPAALVYPEGNLTWFVENL